MSGEDATANTVLKWFLVGGPLSVCLRGGRVLGCSMKVVKTEVLMAHNLHSNKPQLSRLEQLLYVSYFLFWF